MDQIVERLKPAPAPSIEADLSLNNAARRPLRRFWLWAGLVIVLAAAAAGGYRYLSPASPVIAYQTVAVEPGNLTVEVTATGTLQPLTQVDVSSELSGVVRSVPVEENQRVSKGQVIAELDPTRLAAQVERARASAKAAAARVTDARVTVKETQLAFTRAEELQKRGMGTVQALETATAARDRAESALVTAEANVAVAEADLKLQQSDLAKTKIFAPIDGVVLKRDVDPGQTVASSLQAPVLFIIAAELEKMQLNAAVDEADIGTVAKGQKARFTVDAFPDRRFDASIRDIAFNAVTTEGVVTYEARLDVANAELLLRPGMTATVSIVTRQANDVLLVPSAALRFTPPVTAERRGFSIQNLFGMPRMRNFGGRTPGQARDDGLRTLYVLKDGRPQPVRVKTGAVTGESTEIVSGLAAGDLVVIGTRAAGSAAR